MSLPRSLSPRKQKKSDDDIQTVTVTSPLEHVSASAVPYYKGDYSSGDQDLVNTQYTVFAMDQLKVPDDIKNALQFGVPAYLRGYQAPNVEPVFIHLDVNSVKYANANDYSFNFYTDSPEQYFSYTVAPTDDARSNAVITAIGGGWL